MKRLVKPFRKALLFLEKRKSLAWSLTILYAGLIFYLSSLSALPPAFIPAIPSFFKHMVEYSILGFLLLASFRSSEQTKKNALLFAIIIASVYGITDEFHQFFVPGRVLSFLDMAADSIGSFFAMIVNPKAEKLKGDKILE